MLPDGKERKDEHGISVATTPEAAARYIDAKGMIRIDTDRLPAAYPLIPDEKDPEHFFIGGMPFDMGDNLSEVLMHANAIRSCAEVFLSQV